MEIKAILHIVADLSLIGNTQMGVETTPDGDLGYRMWGGKDGNGVLTKWLAKGKPGSLTTIKLTGPTTTGAVGVLQHDSNGNVTGGALTPPDHGTLSGLGDDDHTQYSLVNGTRPFTDVVAGVTPTADAHLATKKYVDDGIAAAGGGGPQPLLILAGAWTPLSGNTFQVYTPVERTPGGAHDVVFNTIEFPENSTDEWHITIRPPGNWTSGKIKFTPDFIITDDIATPGTCIFELGAEYMASGANPDAMTFQTVLSSLTPTDIDPVYYVGPTSAELTLTGSPAAGGSISLRIKRSDTDTEEATLFFIGAKLEFVE